MPLSSSLVRPWPLTSRPQLLRAVAIPAVRQPSAARVRRCQTLRAEPPRSTTKWVWEQQLSACRGSVMRLSVSSDQTHAVITQTPHTHELWASASHVWMSVLFHFSYISGLFVYYLSMSVWTRQAGQWFENVFTESSLTCVCVCFRGRQSSVALYECMFELPQVCVQLTRAQVLLLNCMYHSWMYGVEGGTCSGISDTLINHAYRPPGTVPTHTGVSIHTVSVCVWTAVSLWSHSAMYSM